MTLFKVCSKTLQLLCLAMLATGCSKHHPNQNPQNPTNQHDLVVHALQSEKSAQNPGLTPGLRSFLDSCTAGMGETAAEINPLAKIKNLSEARQGIELSTMGALAAHWTVMGPAGPLMRMTESDNLQFDFKPEIPGEYVVTLYVKNQNGLCSARPALARFGVTVDAPYGGPTHPTFIEPLSKFTHLATINAVDVRHASRNGEGIIIAILDSGVNYNHPDLSRNILVRDGKMVGHDFADDDEFPMDDNGHGTHVAGLAAGLLGGVAAHARIMPVKVLDALGDGKLGDIVAGIRFAIDNGADILVLSFGSTSPKFRDGLKPALDDALARGVLIVTAAGNAAPNAPHDNDGTPYYPASSGYPNVLSVAAIDWNGDLASYSRYGKTSVDLAAPGGSLKEGLLSTAFWPLDTDAYTRHSGTSMAAPLVAGAAALLKADHPELTAVQLKERLLAMGHQTISLRNYVNSSAVLNVDEKNQQ